MGVIAWLGLLLPPLLKFAEHLARGDERAAWELWVDMQRQITDELARQKFSGSSPPPSL